jgi:hypothetical protein
LKRGKERSDKRNGWVGKGKKRKEKKRDLVKSQARIESKSVQQYYVHV